MTTQRQCVFSSRWLSRSSTNPTMAVYETTEPPRHRTERQRKSFTPSAVRRQSLPYRCNTRLVMDLCNETLATSIGDHIPAGRDQCGDPEGMHRAQCVGFVTDVAHTMSA
jgi:hypothetical protein